ncbi:hypothetical protein K493DRAFT_296220 [Basidiobolus meristosporus CBS 931.73]|uniref:Uncharacterized protein n=1 Tax=Basidiobolus meristosporus CBS 931.73 TaxID=1314790 RepID=A0A1Y1Z6S3_9FUNG|nr:hypothetical protein K493DRAFT_296220 [Basidiobolus meristosporus CBS 931.73]|eukprot:ORY05972.1 hypothetical protein K493DRAFT_296220 [Basidiobolus meristosporus CBS 931.73]
MSLSGVDNCQVRCSEVELLFSNYRPLTNLRKPKAMLASRPSRILKPKALACAHTQTSHAGFHRLSKFSAQEKPRLRVKLPGENSGEKPGLSKLLGFWKENTFRTVNTKAEYDVVNGKEIVQYLSQEIKESGLLSRSCWWPFWENPGAARVVTFCDTCYKVKPEYRGLVKMNVYPVPNGGGIPFGVYLVPTINAHHVRQLIVGPGGCIAFAREDYQFWDFKLSDV